MMFEDYYHIIQAVGRDDFRFAMKAPAICVDEENLLRPIFKNRKLLRDYSFNEVRKATF